MATKLQITDYVVRIAAKGHTLEGKRFKINTFKGENGVMADPENESFWLIDDDGNDFHCPRRFCEVLIPAIVHCQYWEQKGDRYAPKGGVVYHVHLPEREAYDPQFLPGVESEFVAQFHRQFNQLGLPTRCEIRSIEVYERPTMLSFDNDGKLTEVY